MDAKKQQNKKEPPFKERFKMNCNEAAHQIKLAKEEAIAHRRYIDEQADNFIRLINAKSDEGRQKKPQNNLHNTTGYSFCFVK